MSPPDPAASVPHRNRSPRAPIPHREFHPHAIPGTTGGPTIGPGPARYMPPSCFGADTAQYSFPKDKYVRVLDTHTNGVRSRLAMTVSGKRG